MPTIRGYNVHVCIEEWKSWLNAMHTQRHFTQLFNRTEKMLPRLYYMHFSATKTRKKEEEKPKPS